MMTWPLITHESQTFHTEINQCNTEAITHTLSFRSAHCLADIVTLSDGEVDIKLKDRAVLLLLRSLLYNDCGLGPLNGRFLNITLTLSVFGEVFDPGGGNSWDTGGGSDEPPIVAPIETLERPKENFNF